MNQQYEMVKYALEEYMRIYCQLQNYIQKELEDFEMPIEESPSHVKRSMPPLDGGKTIAMSKDKSSVVQANSRGRV